MPMLEYILIYSAAAYTISIHLIRIRMCALTCGYTHTPCHNRRTKQPFFTYSNLKVYGDILLLIKNNSTSFLSEKLRMDTLTLLIPYILDSQRYNNAIA